MQQRTRHDIDDDYDGENRPRKWTLAERERILAAAFAPDAVVARVARQFDLASTLIYAWRRQATGMAMHKNVGFSGDIWIYGCSTH